MTRLFVISALTLTLTACEGEHGRPHEAPAAPTPEGAADKEIRDKEHGDHDHGAGAAGDELIDEGLADRDLFLIEAADPIHAVRQALAVPVDGRVLRQPVGHKNAHAVAFDHFNGHI